MSGFLDFFEFMPVWQKAATVAITLGACFLLERWVPLFQLNYNKVNHGIINLFFFLGISVINIGFGFVLIKGLWFFEQFELGLLFWFNPPVWCKLVISVLILDLVAQYAVHYCLHRFRWMWKFHKIHHSDTHLDATSGTRHHPGDYLIREIFSFFTLVIMGIPVSHYFLYRFLTINFTYTTHANITVPDRLNRILSLIFVTPDLHKIHHHFQLPWTDRNYGNIFSIWDRIFSTLVQDSPQKVQYGLDEVGDQFTDGIRQLLVMPWVQEGRKLED